MENEFQPICFVLMPFGTKDDPASNAKIDFDKIYNNAIKPAIEESGLRPVRADEERTGGIIHKPMFERLLLCEYAIADLTTANPNVFYELGVRHTARPRTTITIFAEKQPMPFDVNYLRSIPYQLGPNNSFGEEFIQPLKGALKRKLADLRETGQHQSATDSPLFQLVSDWRPEIDHLKTDLFYERALFSDDLKERMAKARRASLEEKDSTVRLAAVQDLADIQNTLQSNPDTSEPGVWVELLLSYRALEEWSAMIQLYESMPDELRSQYLVREQYGFGLNRQAEKTKDESLSRKALEVLEKVEDEIGANPETCGLIGRIYKSGWQKEEKAGHYNEPRVRGRLQKAIEVYRRGFYADQRDFYPGINLLSLLECKGNDDALQEKDRTLPVVEFAVDRRLEKKSPDYWDYATKLELCVLKNDEENADRYLELALTAYDEAWMPKTTAEQFEFIARARERRNENTEWLRGIIEKMGA